MKRAFSVCASVIVVVLAASAASRLAVPSFQVDPFWPKPLPHDWIVGNVTGVAVDAKDNVYMLHRPKSQAGGASTPPLLVFDPAGNLINSWGGQPTPDGRQATLPEWGTQEHGLYIDPKGNVWVSFGGGLPWRAHQPNETSEWVRDGWYGNAHVLKFSHEGKLLLKIGEWAKTAGSSSTQYLGGPTAMAVDPNTDEVYITDGYINRRVIVFDASTGAYKRHWGAYGKPPDDTVPLKRDQNGPPARQFDTPHCVKLSNDGLIYVCDRDNQRFQVFKHDGTFVTEKFIRIKGPDGLNLPGETVDDLVMSRDPQQSLLFVLDITHEKIATVDRQTLEVLSSWGQRGRWAGEFETPHDLDIDSKGNLFIGETLDGRRLQKFFPTKGTKGKSTNP